MEEFIHLHNHTEFSLLDGVARIKKLVSVSHERGAKAVAITDHGNMYGALSFYTECLQKGIKPIIGTEFYFTEDLHKKHSKTSTNHLILLAKNDVGYSNLLKLNSIAHVEGFYYKPRIDFEVLKQHHEGLICMSACLAGEIPQHIMHGELDKAEEAALRMHELFGDDFYLEIQNHGINEEKVVMQALGEMSKKLGIKLVATNDVHYINKEDAEMQDVLMCVQMGKTVYDQDRLKFETDEFYLKTTEEMKEAFVGFEEALETPIEIADKCDVVIKTKLHGELGFDSKYCLPATQNYIPLYKAPDGMDNYDYLIKLTYDGLKQKYPEITEAIKSRADSELKIIHDQGFVEYFLVVWDYINWARTNGIPVGPGRGSGAGSLVAYASGITLVDPLKYDLIFERFIHKERVSMPDFDVDFDYDRRSEVIDYVRRKYGDECVAMIVTFGTMAAKNAIRDVARVLKMPYSEADKLTKLIPDKPPAGISKPPVLKYYFGVTGKEEDKKYIVSELRELYDSDPQIKKIADMAVKLEGSPRNTSMHAAGVLIAPARVDSFVPLSRNGEDITTQFNMIELEQLGLLKMDFLGLRTLTDINKAIIYVKENTGKEIDFYDMEYNDPNVYALIGSGNTDAVFQLESGGMKKFMKELKPDCLEDIIAGISLYRPGPMDSIPTYVKNKKNPKEVVYAHPCLESILDVTYGCIVYQEQVMKVFQVMGGYSLGQADNVRRIMSKKKKDKMAAEKQKFIYGWEDPKGEKSIPGAIKLGVPEEVAEKVFAEMETFASYAFNKSHAAAYAYLAYQTAYLKCYHEPELLAAVLNNRITNSDEIKKYVSYAKTENIEVLPPDINLSETSFKAKDRTIRFGLAGLKNVGVGVVESIIEERRKNGPYKDFVDFAKRVDTQALNKRCLESLILSGAFDTFKVYRSQLMQIYEMVVDRVAKERKNRESGQFSFFDTAVQTDFKIDDKIEYPNIKEFNKDSKLKFEKEVVGIYLSGHPLDEYLDKFAQFNLTSNMFETDNEEEVEADAEDEGSTAVESLENNMAVTCGGIITEIKKVTTKATNKDMAIIKIEDIYGTLDVMLVPNVYAKYRSTLNEDQFVTIKGKLSIRDGERPTVIAEVLNEWQRKDETELEKEDTSKKLYLKFEVENPILYNVIDKILTSYPGENEVVVKSSQTGKVFALKGRKVSINNHLINELYGVVEQQNVIVR